MDASSIDSKAPRSAADVAELLACSGGGESHEGPAGEHAAHRSRPAGARMSVLLHASARDTNQKSPAASTAAEPACTTSVRGSHARDKSRRRSGVSRMC